MATILIVAERAPSRRRLVAAVVRMGHGAAEAASGEQALATISASRPDLILIDILMPSPGGYQLVRNLQAQADLAPPRVVFLAASHMTSEARLLAHVSGFADAVVDIADAQALQAAVRDALSHPPPAALPMQLLAAADDPLYPLVNRLCDRVAELETYSASLELNSAVRAAQLAVARSAIDREVAKRLTIEEDMTKRYQRLRMHALRDPLTGLFNRRYLEASLPREESRARRSGKPLAMMMVDIEGTSCRDAPFDDDAAAEMLRAVGRCMTSMARAEDIVCRYGAEQFALVMVDTAPDALRRRVDVVREGVPKLQVEHRGRRIAPAGLAIGTAIFPDDGDRAALVLAVADTAMRRAKRLADHIAGSVGVGAQEP